MYIVDGSQTLNEPVNPCHGCRFRGGFEMPTRTPTPTYPYLQPARVRKPMTIPSLQGLAQRGKYCHVPTHFSSFWQVMWFYELWMNQKYFCQVHHSLYNCTDNILSYHQQQNQHHHVWSDTSYIIHTPLQIYSHWPHHSCGWHNSCCCIIVADTNTPATYVFWNQLLLVIWSILSFP